MISLSLISCCKRHAWLIRSLDSIQFNGAVDYDHHPTRHKFGDQQVLLVLMDGTRSILMIFIEKGKSSLVITNEKKVIDHFKTHPLRKYKKKKETQKRKFKKRPLIKCLLKDNYIYKRKETKFYGIYFLLVFEWARTIKIFAHVV